MAARARRAGRRRRSSRQAATSPSSAHRWSWRGSTRSRSCRGARPTPRPSARAAARPWRSPRTHSDEAMTGHVQGPASAPAAHAGEEWSRLDECLDRAPRELHPWLAEPGLLTAHVRRACGGETRFRLIRVEKAPLAAATRVAWAWRIPAACCERSSSRVEHALDLRAVRVPGLDRRQHPWLAELGNVALGESLLRARGREPPTAGIPGAYGGRRPCRRGGRPRAPRVGTPCGLPPVGCADHGAGGVPAGAGSRRPCVCRPGSNA